MKSLLLLTLSASIAEAYYGFSYGRRVSKVHQMGADPVPGYGHIYNGTFKQLLDHSDPSLGTFDQTFYYDARFYKGAGSPIIMQGPQEANASEYLPLLTDHSMVGYLAQKLGGASVLMEHRYWGNSSPYKELSTANMQYLTLENAIADCVYFAQNVDLPFTSSDSNADTVPWVYVGGSYSGALSAWIAAKSPGTFWAYIASSAVVETIADFWQYYAQIQYGMPQNCSKDTTLVVDHMDTIFETGTDEETHNLKAMFGLEDLEHNDDVMNALTEGPALWQNPMLWYDDGFYTWCDWVEGVYSSSTQNKTIPGPEGVGLQTALEGYAGWFKTVLLPGFCKNEYGYFQSNTSVECFNTYNASSPIFTDLTVSNTADRQWEWMLCNQPFGYWQNGAPKDNATIVSRLITVDYWTRQCALYFPTGPQGQTYGTAEGATESQVNAYTGGWFIDNTTRLIYGNGQFDPWRDSTVSSFFRPGGPLVSTEQVPVNVVPGGNHASDLFIRNGKVDPGCLVVQEKEIATITQWVNEFPKGGYRWKA